MKSQACRPPSAPASLRALQAVLADEGHAGLRQRPHLLKWHVLGRGQHLDLLTDRFPDPGEVGSDPLGLEPFDQAGHLSSPPTMRCPPAARFSGVPPVEKKR